MPARKHASWSSFRDRAVKAMTGWWPPVVRSRSRIAATTWKPSSSGMWMSNSNRSIGSRSSSASASRPLPHRRRESQAGQHVFKEISVEVVVLHR